MNRLTLLFAALALIIAAPTFAVPESPHPGGIHISRVAGTQASYKLSWQGVAGYSYFIQTTLDAVNGPWTYAPVIEYGTGGQADQIEWGITATEPQIFLRLRYTDASVSGGNPDTADFDGDGLSNADELWPHNIDPLDSDTDGDGLSDGQEVSDGTDPLKVDMPEITIQHRWRQGNAWKLNANTNARIGSTSNPSNTAQANFTSTSFNPVTEAPSAMSVTGNPALNALNWLDLTPGGLLVAHVHACLAPSNYTAPGGAAITQGVGTADCRELDVRIKTSRTVKFAITKKLLQVQRVKLGSTVWTMENLDAGSNAEVLLTIEPFATWSPPFHRSLPSWTGVVANGSTNRREIILVDVQVVEADPEIRARS